MNLSEPDIGLPLDMDVIAQDDLPKVEPTFMGDNGELPLEIRKVLVRLLAGPSLEGRRHSKLWPVLLRNEMVIRSRLSELFLDLVLNRELEVAFTRQSDTNELPDIPLLLRRVPLTFIDSVVLLHLRKWLAQADTRGERAVISINDIMEHLNLYERSSNTDKVTFAKRVNAAVEKMKKYNILQKIRTSDDRFEIVPTLKLLFSAEEVQALTHLYQKIQAGVMPEEISQESEQVGVDE